MSENHVNAFAKLGDELREILDSGNFEKNTLGRLIKSKMTRAFNENGWFTDENILLALKGIGKWLNKSELEQWISHYNFGEARKRIGIIMAGNIPMVGFHDYLCVVLSGNKALIKMSSSDKVLLPVLLDRLVKIDQSLKDSYEITERLSSYDAVIATGSNNSARYFEYYFKEKPHIIRKNRNSVAVLTGNESEESLAEFGKDIFNFYGLGCRNVSKIFIPEKYDLDNIFGSISTFSDVAMNKKYANNYDYYKTLYIMNKEDLIENGFFLMKEDSSLHSPVSMLFYQHYRNDSDLLEKLHLDSENIQCIVSEHSAIKEAVSFGKSQSPGLRDYADGVDTMEFLAGL